MNVKMPAAPAGLIRRLNEGGFQAYVVGGCVRDALMGREPHDWDICTDALPEQVLTLFADHRTAETGLQHGTVMVIEDGEGYEITTFRTDGAYTDHRHPDAVTFVPDLREDLARRDFTINAMAYHPRTGLVDLYGGQSDLDAGLIRCVGRAEERFEEDALRILRAVRFASRFGFAIAEDTAAAMRVCAPSLDYVAVERIFTELKGFLIGPGVTALLLEWQDLLGQLMPELTPMFGFEQRNPHHCYDVWTHTAHVVGAVPPEVSLRLAALFHDAGKPACWSRDEHGIDHFYGHAKQSVALAKTALTRLRCDNQTRDEVLDQILWHDLPLPRTEKEGRRFLNRMGTQGALWSLELHRADALGQNPATWPEKLAWAEESRGLLDALIARGACFSLRDLAVNGYDLMELGLKKGPEIGKALHELLEAVLDGACPNEREALLARLQKKYNC